MIIRSLTAIAILAGLSAGSLAAQESDLPDRRQDQPDPVKQSEDLSSYDVFGSVDISDPETFRHVLLTWAQSLEETFGVGSRASNAFSEASYEDLETWLSYMDDREQFLGAVGRTVARLEAAKASAGAAASQLEFKETTRQSQGVVGILPAVIAPFPTDYPPNSGAYKNVVINGINAFGIAATSQDRCDNASWDDFLAAWYIIFKTLSGLDGACTVAGCDPTGIVCASVCAPLAIAAVGLEIAAVPVDLCDIHAGAVDSAEIEAAYENSLIIIEGLQCVEAIQDRMNHGCNGEDDDCDGTIDECDEDIFGPVVFIDQSVTKCCYDDATEARDAVALAVKAWDDCGNITIGPPNVIGNQCDRTVEVTATDDCGIATTASTVVTIDGDGPTVTINPTVADVCYGSIDAAEQAVLNATTITDNCDSVDDLTVTVHSSVEECALRVRIKAVDKCGNETTKAVTVRVDLHIPSVDIQVLRLGFRGEVLAFQTPVCYETIAQAEQAVLAVTHAEDNCTVGKELVTSVSSAGDPCSLLVTSKAVDECGNENTDSETVRVDAEDPVVTCAVAKKKLSPPNHKMVNVGFTFTATDNCSGDPEIEIFVTSDETTASADGAGQTSPAPDAFILRDLNGVFQGILLRKERSSAGNGRVYEITVRATDECGNVGSCSANVTVAPSNDNPVVDDGQFFDATEVN